MRIKVQRTQRTSQVSEVLWWVALVVLAGGTAVLDVWVQVGIPG